jgi:hypothetical protein
MRRTLWIAACAFLLAQCAIHKPGPQAFSFGVMGDVPYNAREEAHFMRMLRRIDGEPLAFVVHVGDFNGAERCTDAFYEKRRAQFDSVAHPFVYTPGDNEWVDCRTAVMGSMDPLERLASLRRIFFSEDTTLGRRRFALEAQRECVDGTDSACRCAIYRENRRWRMHGIQFVTLNYAGQDNNLGNSPAGDAEARCRNEANRRWLARAFAESGDGGVAALVVITQANPWFTPNHAFDTFIAQLGEGAYTLRKPVLLVHGDTHIYRADNPFADTLGNPRPGITRLETFGSPFVGWVRVNVDVSRSSPFSFEPRLAAVVLPD